MKPLFSVNIKKIWYSVTDGQGRPVDWVPIIENVKEGTFTVTQGTPSVTPLKNELGQTKASKVEASQKEITLEIIGIDPALIQKFAGGTVTTSGGIDEYASSLAPNSLQRLGILALSDNGILYEIPYVEFSAAPQIDNTADGQRFVASGASLYPRDGKSADFYIYRLSSENQAKAEIEDISFPEVKGSPTINVASAKVTAIASGATLTAITPHIKVSKGAYVSSPLSGETQDFTATVNYVVEAANGSKRTWAVKITQ